MSQISPLTEQELERVWRELCKMSGQPPDLVRVRRDGRWYEWDRRTDKVTLLEEGAP